MRVAFVGDSWSYYWILSLVEYSSSPVIDSDVSYIENHRHLSIDPFCPFPGSWCGWSYGFCCC